MGQQQMLLMLLAALVVGLAISVGVEQFSEGAKSSDKEEIRNLATNVAIRAQAWYRSSELTGGGGRSFLDFTLEKIHCDNPNVSGSLVVSDVQDDTFTLTGTIPDEPTWSLVVEVFADSVATVENN